MAARDRSARRRPSSLRTTDTRPPGAGRSAPCRSPRARPSWSATPTIPTASDAARSTACPAPTSTSPTPAFLDVRVHAADGRRHGPGLRRRGRCGCCTSARPAAPSPGASSTSGPARASSASTSTPSAGARARWFDLPRSPRAAAARRRRAGTSCLGAGRVLRRRRAGRLRRRPHARDHVGTREMVAARRRRVLRPGGVSWPTAPTGRRWPGAARGRDASPRRSGPTPRRRAGSPPSPSPRSSRAAATGTWSSRPSVSCPGPAADAARDDPGAPTGRRRPAPTSRP